MKIEIKNGTVTNDGEPVGTIENGVCTLTASIPPVIKGAINSIFGSKLTFVVEGSTGTGEVEEEPEEETVRLDGLNDDELLAEIKKRGLIKDGESASVGVAAEKSNIPPPPAQHPAMGDKDPAYVAWFRRHHSEEDFAAKYHDSRKLPTVAEFQRGEQKMRGKLQDEKTDKGE